MTQPRTITEHIEWVVAGQPKMCMKCEHQHYPRRRVEQGVSGPQTPQLTWKYCEESSCLCDRLRTA